MGIDGDETAKALEILREGINEVIVTTKENTAPIGIIRHGQSLHMAVYLTSHTAQNIQQHPWAVLHITDDTRWFVKTAFSDPEPNEYISEELNGIYMQRLKKITSWIACTCTIKNKTAQQILVSLTPIRAVQSQHVFHPVNRGYNSIIEATVHATRYIHTKDPVLGDLITFHLGIAKKCGDGTVKESISLLQAYLKMYNCDL